MKYEWLDEYLLQKPGVTKDFKIEWEWFRYQVGGKLFAAVMHPNNKHDPLYAEKDLINLKCDPLLSELMRNEHKEIMPGFYSDKRHWISVDLGGNLDDDLLKKLCDDSYELVFKKLTKKMQREITQLAL